MAAADVQLSPEAAQKVEDTLQDGAQRITDMSKVVGTMAETARFAHTGSGAPQMEQNYRDLQRIGLGIAQVIDRLAGDFNMTINTGFEMEDMVRGEMSRAAADGGGGGIDPTVARAI